MEIIIGYILASLIGISLGLIGGGGSILTVPVLVYVMGISATLSTAYSLFIVGVTALVGSFSYMKKQLISLKTAIVFSIPSFLSVFVVRKYIVPAIPTDVLKIGTFVLTKDILLMIVFAILMIFASSSMIFGKKDTKESSTNNIQFNFPLIFIEGFIVGAITGLVVFAKLPMKMAVGTSLFIIAAKSLIGFLGDATNPNLQIDWMMLIFFSAIASVGIFIGSYLSNFIEGVKLKKGFGWFVVVMAVYILLKELVFK